MITEITDINAKFSAGWIFYDGHCRLCSGNVRRFAFILKHYGWRFMPLHDPLVPRLLNLSPEAAATEFRVLTDDGRSIAGASAWIRILASIWWLWPLSVLCRVPGLHWLFNATYQFVASHRYCIGGQCKLTRTRSD